MSTSVSYILLLISTSSFTFGQHTPQVKKTLNDDFVKMPTLQWKFSTHAPILSTPVISQDVVYTGSLDSTLYAVEITTGKLKWKFKTGGEIRSSVLVLDQLLFLYSGDATLYSIDKSTGKLLWKFKAKGGVLGDRRYDFADYFQSSPVFDNGRIYFGSGDGRVYSLDATTGSVVWSFKTNGIIHTTPALYKDRLFVGSFDGHLYALGKNEGDLLWKFKTVGHRYFPDGEAQGMPVVMNDLVYFGARDYNLYAIDAMDGYTHWNKSFPFGWAMALTPRDSVIYAGTSDDRALVAIDGASGHELWRTDTKFNIFGSCTYSKSMAYVGTLMGKLFAIDLKRGDIKWIFSTDGYHANRLKFFKADDTFHDHITNIIKTPADFIAMEYALGGVFSSPAISKDYLVLTTTEGLVYSFKR